MLSVSLDCPFLIAPSVFSNVISSSICIWNIPYLIQYSRACACHQDFLDKWFLPTRKLLKPLFHVSRWPRIFSVSRSHNPVLLFSFIMYHRILQIIVFLTIVTRRIWYQWSRNCFKPFQRPHFLSGSICLRTLTFYLVFCKSVLVSLSVFFNFCIVCYSIYGVWLLFWYLHIFLISRGCVDQYLIVRVLFSLCPFCVFCNYFVCSSTTYVCW